MDPGYTKWRGSLLQELIQTLMLISKEDHNAERISSEVSSNFFSQIYPRNFESDEDYGKVRPKLPSFNSIKIFAEHSLFM